MRFGSAQVHKNCYKYTDKSISGAQNSEYKTVWLVQTKCQTHQYKHTAVQSNRWFLPFYTHATTTKQSILCGYSQVCFFFFACLNDCLLPPSMSLLPSSSSSPLCRCNNKKRQFAANAFNYKWLDFSFFCDTSTDNKTLFRDISCLLIFVITFRLLCKIEKRYFLPLYWFLNKKSMRNFIHVFFLQKWPKKTQKLDLRWH